MPLRPPKGKPECRNIRDEQVITVGGIDQAAFGWVQFNSFVLCTHRLVFDFLKVPPVAEDSFAIAAADVQVGMFGVPSN